MRARRLLCLAVAGLLAGCAHSSEELAVCDGKHRRDANPYGSVLTEDGGPIAPVAPPAPPQPCTGAGR